jgi:hypothetical protein
MRLSSRRGALNTGDLRMPGASLIIGLHIAPPSSYRAYKLTPMIQALRTTTTLLIATVELWRLLRSGSIPVQLRTRASLFCQNSPCPVLEKELSVVHLNGVSLLVSLWQMQITVPPS